MAKKKDDKVPITLRVERELRVQANIKASKEETSVQAILEEALKQWVGEAAIETSLAQDSDPEEVRLISEYRRSTIDKRRKMLAFAAKIEEPIGPEALPGRRQGPRAKAR